MDAETPKPGLAPNIVDSADAFMNRLRPPAEEDVPLLTEVVEVLPTEVPPVAAPLLTAEVKAALSQELENWLDMHLTEAVLKVLDGVADQLVARITQDAREDLLPRLQATLETIQTQPPVDN